MDTDNGERTPPPRSVFTLDSAISSARWSVALTFSSVALIALTILGVLQPILTCGYVIALFGFDCYLRRQTHTSFAAAGSDQIEATFEASTTWGLVETDSVKQKSMARVVARVNVGATYATARNFMGAETMISLFSATLLAFGLELTLDWTTLECSVFAMSAVLASAHSLYNLGSRLDDLRRLRLAMKTLAGHSR